MVLKAGITFLLSITFLSNTAHAKSDKFPLRDTSLKIAAITDSKKSQFLCLGKNDDSSKTFYAQKINALVSYTQKATKKLKTLQKRNEAISNEIKTLNTKKNKLLKDSKKKAFFNSKESQKKILNHIQDIENNLSKLYRERDQIFNGKDITNKSDIEKSKIEPENYLAYHGIKDINKNLAAFRFIAHWWADQGLKHFTDRSNTAAQICENCEEADNPESSILSKITEFLKIPKLKIDCVRKSIKIKEAETKEVLCENSETAAGSTRNSCVTQNIADYTQWALNKGLECLSPRDDPIDPQVVFRKLNNESTFRFFYSYNGGQGLMQTVTCAQDEVLGLSPSKYCVSRRRAKRIKTQYRSQARKKLAALMTNNRDSCNIYKDIIDFESEHKLDTLNTKSREYKKLIENYPLHDERLFNAKQSNSCDFISLQDGIHRNILAGLGLYLYYRDLAEDDLRRNFGENVKKHPQYKKIRDLTALVYYGPTGPSGASNTLDRMAPDIRAKFKKNLRKMSPDEYEKELKKKFRYVRAINNSENAISRALNGADLLCTE